MQFVADIVNVSEVQTIPTKAGKSYQQIEVAYKRDGKMEGKKIMSFSNPAVFTAVKGLKAGDTVTITSEKSDQGYWNWTAVSAGASPPAASSSSSSPAKSGGSWETKEEREARQLYIIRQSSIGHAVELLASNGGKKNTAEDVIAVAEQFVNYVTQGVQKASAASSSFEDDIPM